MEDRLQIITQLSHEFGSDTYVRGGGGNTSAKDDKTIWVKPSGTHLKTIQTAQFVALDRATLSKLYSANLPAPVPEREKAVQKLIEASVLPTSKGRPSVESPLHNSFSQTYVVHTHPGLVNGMTCAREGAAACRELFPDAVWIDYVDPGYTLCMRTRELMHEFEKAHGRSPDKVFMQNHGVFVAADSADGIRAVYRNVLDRLLKAVKAKNVVDLPRPTAPVVPAGLAERMKELAGDDGAEMFASGPFPVATGPISPDHIVYAKSYIFQGDPTREGLTAFKEKRGYWPKVIACAGGVFGFGHNPKSAELAVELAWDGATIVNYAQAFGGMRYLDDRSTGFIENWEMETYRNRISTS